MSKVTEVSVLFQLRRALSHTLATLGNVAEAGDVASSVLVVQAEISKAEALKELEERKAKLP